MHQAKAVDKRLKHPEDARSIFDQWVRDYGGPAKLSRDLGTHYTAVFSWLRRSAVPSLPVAVKLIDLSKGKLTAHEILEGTRAW